MPKIDITRTELVWPGKYDENGNLVPPRRVSLPFQVIKLVNEICTSRQQKFLLMRNLESGELDISVLQKREFLLS